MFLLGQLRLRTMPLSEQVTRRLSACIYQPIGGGVPLMWQSESDEGKMTKQEPHLKSTQGHAV